jgi:hypothetical protein
MKPLCVGLVLLLIIACGPPMIELMEQARMENRQKLVRLSIGMTKAEVFEVMGTKTMVLTSTADLETEVRKINNPYRVESAKDTLGQTYEILFYYTDLKKADGVISDDELTPLVIKDGKLIGWGWTFLGDNIKRYQIDIR